jgi:hypothetical protein
METIGQMAKDLDNHGAGRLAQAMDHLAWQEGERWKFYSPFRVSLDGDKLNEFAPDTVASKGSVSFEKALTQISERYGVEAASKVIYGRMPLEDVLGPRGASARALP